MPKLGEPVEEVEHSSSKLAFGAVEGGVNDLLAQVFPEALNQVQIRRVRRQKHLADGFIRQPLPQVFVLVVAGVVADDVNARLVGVSG